MRAIELCINSLHLPVRLSSVLQTGGVVISFLSLLALSYVIATALVILYWKRTVGVMMERCTFFGSIIESAVYL